MSKPHSGPVSVWSRCAAAVGPTPTCAGQSRFTITRRTCWPDLTNRRLRDANPASVFFSKHFVKDPFTLSGSIVSLFRTDDDFAELLLEQIGIPVIVPISLRQ